MLIGGPKRMFDYLPKKYFLFNIRFSMLIELQRRLCDLKINFSLYSWSARVFLAMILANNNFKILWISKELSFTFNTYKEENFLQNKKNKQEKWFLKVKKCCGEPAIIALNTGKKFIFGVDLFSISLR